MTKVPAMKHCETTKDMDGQAPSWDEGCGTGLSKNHLEAGEPSKTTAFGGKFSEHAAVKRMLEGKLWKDLMEFVVDNSESCLTPFSDDEAKGNLLLHEACRAKAPLFLIEKIFEINKKAIRSRGKMGYLPLHHACANEAEEEVISFLLNKFPMGIHVVEDGSGMLPLHVACKHGLSDGGMMVLLTIFPEGICVKDQCGNTAVELARSISNEQARDSMMKSLANGKLLCAAAASARHWVEATHKEELASVKKEKVSQILKLEENLQQLKDDFFGLSSSLQQKIDEQAKMINTLEDQMKSQEHDFKKKVALTEESNIELQSSLEEKNGFIEILRNQVDDLRITHKNELDEVYERHQSKMEELQHTLRNQDSEIGTLRNQDSEIETLEAAELRKQLDSERQKTSRTQQALETKVGELATARIDIHLLEMAHKQELNDLNEGTKVELETMRSSYEAKEEMLTLELSKIKKEKLRAEEKANLQETKISRLESILEAEMAEMAEPDDHGSTIWENAVGLRLGLGLFRRKSAEQQKTVELSKEVELFQRKFAEQEKAIELSKAKLLESTNELKEVSEKLRQKESEVIIALAQGRRLSSRLDEMNSLVESMHQPASTESLSKDKAQTEKIEQILNRSESCCDLETRTEEAATFSLHKFLSMVVPVL